MIALTTPGYIGMQGYGGGGYTDNIILEPSGYNVGIGVTNPSEKLDVNGKVQATGFYTLSGNVTATSATTIFSLTGSAWEAWEITAIGPYSAPASGNMGNGKWIVFCNFNEYGPGWNYGCVAEYTGQGITCANNSGTITLTNTLSSASYPTYWSAVRIK